MPWFIVGFLMLAGLRSADAVPHAAFGPMAAVANLQPIVSKASLGLGHDVRMVARAGTRVIAAATLSLVVLGAISCGLIHLLGLV